jgi:hypothetical protein
MAEERDIHHYCRAQKKFAWAKYYEALRDRAETAVVVFRQAGIPTTSAAAPTECPAHLSKEFFDMALELRKEMNCPICMEAVNRENVVHTFCGHLYCQPCLDQLKAQPQPKCATCRRKLG